MQEKNGFLLISKYRGAIMGFAALWILFFHEWQQLFRNVAQLSFAESFLKRIGFCGVDIFLLLSGMGLTFAIGKSSIGTFYYKRFKRLFVPFLTIAIIRCILENWSVGTFFKNITGINFYTRSMYSFLWFVTAIATLYLLFPLYYKLLSWSSNPVLFTVCIIFLWLTTSIYARGTDRQDLFGFTNRIPVFLIGILIGWLAQNKTFRFDGVTWCFFGMMLITGVYLSYMTNYQGMYLLVQVSNCCVPNLLIAVSLVFLLAKLFAVLSETPVLKYIGIPLTGIHSFFGLFTLELYCVQELIGNHLIPALRPKFSSALINLFLLLAVTAAALLLWLVQIPFWKLVDRGLTKAGFLKPPFRIFKKELPVRRAPGKDETSALPPDAGSTAGNA